MDYLPTHSRFKRTQIVKFAKDKQEKSEDADFWNLLEFPITIQESGAINRLDVSPVAPHLLAMTGAARIQMFHPEAKDVTKTFSKFRNGVRGGRFRQSDGLLIAAGSDEGEVKIFNLETKTTLRDFKGHENAVHRVDFLSDSKTLVSFSDDKTVRLWDIATSENVQTFKGHLDYVRCGCVSATSSDLVVSGSYDHTVKVWDRRRDQAVQTFEHGAPVEDVLLLPNDGLLVSAGGHEIKVWDLLSGSEVPLKVFSPHNKTVTFLGLAQSNTRLVTASLDGHLKFHDTATFKCVHTLRYPSPILTACVAPDDSYVAVGMADGLIQFQHRKTTEEIRAAEAERQKRRMNPTQLRYLKYAEFAPVSTDLVVKPKDREKESKHDYFLRKFEHSKALDAVLKPYIQSKKPEYVYSVLVELERRGKLAVALGGRDAKGLAPFIHYLSKYINDMRFAEKLIQIADTTLDLYADQLGVNPELDRLFVDLRNYVAREESNLKTLMELQGSLELILGASAASVRSVKPALTAQEESLKLEKEKYEVKKYPDLPWNQFLFS